MKFLKLILLTSTFIFQLQAAETLFGEVVLTGEMGKRRILLNDYGAERKILVDEEQMIKDIYALKIPDVEKDGIIAEAQMAFASIPNAIDLTGRGTVKEQLKILNFLSNKNGITKVLTKDPCLYRLSGYTGTEEERREVFNHKYKIEVPKSYWKQMMESGKEFFSLGDLLAITVEVDSVNDNALHGALMKAGITKYNEGFEGDDRGLTFGLNALLEAKFEKGTIAFEVFSNLYSRLAPQRGLDGVTRYLNPESGDSYSENLTDQGIKVSFERDIGEKYFMRVEGERSEIDDITGLALSAQTKWHEGFDQVVYEHIDHFDTQKIASASAGIGQRETLYESGEIKVSTELEIGASISNLSSVSKDYNRTVSSLGLHQGTVVEMQNMNDYSTYASAKVQADYEGFDMSFYGKTDTNNFMTHGLETGYTFNRKGRHQVRMSIGLSEQKNPFTELYQNDTGDAETTHHLGLSYSYKFGK